MHMNRRSVIGGVSALSLASSAWCGTGAAGPARRPNFLFLLADDWGWGSALPIDP